MNLETMRNTLQIKLNLDLGSNDQKHNTVIHESTNELL